MASSLSSTEPVSSGHSAKSGDAFVCPSRHAPLVLGLIIMAVMIPIHHDILNLGVILDLDIVYNLIDHENIQF